MIQSTPTPELDDPTAKHSHNACSSCLALAELEKAWLCLIEKDFSAPESGPVETGPIGPVTPAPNTVMQCVITITCFADLVLVRRLQTKSFI